MEFSTEQKIREVAFRDFLEKGYEATNLRDISKEVGIKASSIYFYYKSKKDLFVKIYDSICYEQMEKIKKIVELKEGLPAKEVLYLVFLNRLQTCINYSAPFKFLLRYRLFPADELQNETRDRYKNWQDEEFNVLQPIIVSCIASNDINQRINEKVFFQKYKRLENEHINEMLIAGIVIAEDEIESNWKNFWERS
ncbi:MAG: TetR/AcrR family transcriptional regulator [Velocimicrobium sp.]